MITTTGVLDLIIIINIICLVCFCIPRVIISFKTKNNGESFVYITLMTLFIFISICFCAWRTTPVMPERHDINWADIRN